MIGLIFRGETNNAADVFSALHRDRSIKECDRCGTRKDTVFRFRMCEQESFAEHHVIAIGIKELDDAIDISLRDEMTMQKLFASASQLAFPEWLARRWHGIARVQV